MKSVHLVGTLVLLIVVLGFGFLALTGVVEVRFARPGIDAATRRGRLVVLRGAKPNIEYPIYEGRSFLGRADQKPVDIDLEIQESPDRIWSSRQHAVIICENGSVTIEDLNSSNGTYVNRDRVQPGQKLPLKANDIIQIGEVHLKLVLGQ